MDTLSLPLLTLYADLQQQLELATEPAGSVFEQEVKGTRYLRAQVDAGRGRRTVHLGPASDPQAQARAAAIRVEMQRAKERRRIVRALRDAGFGNPTPEIAAVAQVLALAGLFGNGVVLVGTGAYQCMAPLVGVRLPVATLMTQDADIATASLAVSADRLDSPEGDEGSAGRALLDILHDADPTFEGLPNLDRKAWPWRFRTAAGFVLDILVPCLRRDDPEPIAIPALQAGGMPIQHMGWLITDPVPAVMLAGSGILVRVPSPARYAIHKLIIAQKRHATAAAKRAKDLEQARSLVLALKARDPWLLRDMAEDAASRGAAGWRQPMERSLAELGLSLD
jgi:hypothetical protein